MKPVRASNVIFKASVFGSRRYRCKFSRELNEFGRFNRLLTKPNSSRFGLGHEWH